MIRSRTKFKDVKEALLFQETCFYLLKQVYPILTQKTMNI